MEKHYSNILFHGTNTRSFYMSEKDRKEAYEICHDLSEVCYQFLKSSGFSVYLNNEELLSFFKNTFKENYLHVLRAYSLYGLYKNGSELYRYDNLYLTGDLRKAGHFATDGVIFGETGWVSSWLLLGSIELNGQFLSTLDDEQFKNAIAFKELADGKGDPMIVLYRNIPRSFLLKENGNEFNDDHFDFLEGQTDGGNYRVAEGADLAPYIIDKIVYRNEKPA